MSVTNYIWDDLSDNVLMETDENGAVTVEYTNEPGLFGAPISQHRSSESSFFCFDGDGSTRQVTDSDQNVTDTEIFTAYGEEVSKTGSRNYPFRYKGIAGYYSDVETGEAYVRARTYDSSIGRWLTQDPIGFVGGVNLYAAYFIPWRRDPSGMLIQEPGLEIRGKRPGGPVLVGEPPGGFPPPFKCTVQLVCADLVFGYEHCGIEIVKDGKPKYYHVVSPTAGIFGDTCDVRDVFPHRINTPIGIGDWRVVEQWHDASGVLCDCISSIADLIRSKRLPYRPFPLNYVYTDFFGICQSLTYCNSNYVTHCIMKKCGIDSVNRSDRVRPGWGHRMKKCIEFVQAPLTNLDVIAGVGCPCDCIKWVTIDDEWCADSPANPLVNPIQVPGRRSL